MAANNFSPLITRMGQCDHSRGMFACPTLLTVSMMEPDMDVLRRVRSRQDATPSGI